MGESGDYKCMIPAWPVFLGGHNCVIERCGTCKDKVLVRNNDTNSEKWIRPNKIELVIKEEQQVCWLDRSIKYYRSVNAQDVVGQELKVQRDDGSWHKATLTKTLDDGFFSFCLEDRAREHIKVNAHNVKTKIASHAIFLGQVERLPKNPTEDPVYVKADHRNTPWEWGIEFLHEQKNVPVSELHAWFGG